MSFLESPRFPDDISYGSRGGPVFKTAIARMDSGHEQRNIQWAYPLHEYDVAYGVRTDAALYDLTHFFMVMHGAGHSFRYKDWADYKSCSPVSTPSQTDCSIGTGDFVTTVFQLQKTYTEGDLIMDRPIKKPVSATVSVAVGGTAMPTANVSVSYASGTVTFAVASANISNITQANPALVTASGHSIQTGQIIYITEVAGMAELTDGWYTPSVSNANQFTLVGVDSSGYGAYASGGFFTTVPPSGAVITAGYEFDVPCRFESDVFERDFEAYNMNSASMRIVELRKGS